MSVKNLAISICLLLGAGLIWRYSKALEATEVGPLVTFDLQNPWAKDEIWADQLRLSASRGTTPNVRAQRALDELLHPLGIAADDVVADIGCGSGYSLPLLRQKVGPNGKVYAVEFAAAALTYLRKRTEALGMDNVVVHRDSEDDILLPSQVLDKSFMINVMHAFATKDPSRITRGGVRFVESIFRSTKPGGVIMIVDSERRPSNDGEDARHNERVISKQLMQAVYVGAGFQMLSLQELGHSNLYSMVFERPNEQ